MANSTKRTKYFYPPRPGSGAGTFSDNLVGIQLVDGGGLTQANFEFTTNVVEKVNRAFNTGAYSTPTSLSDLGIDNLSQSEIISSQFKVSPNYDISQITNFNLYGSLSKRLSVSINKIINFFPAAIDILFTNLNFTTGNTATNIYYDSIEDETYFEIDVDRLQNPFGIDFSISASTNLLATDNEVSEYRNLNLSFNNYVVVVNDIEYQVNSFLPSQTLTSGYIAFYVSGSPFGTTSTIYNKNYFIKPGRFFVNKLFVEKFDEIERFLLNRLVVPIYTSNFDIPSQDNSGQFYIKKQSATWPLDGQWNLDIRTNLFDNYLNILQQISNEFDEFKTNLVSRFLTSSSLKEFDTLGRKVEKVLQLYGRSFDDLKKYIDGLSFINSVNYNISNDIPSELLTFLAQTLGWSTNFSPIVNSNFLNSVFQSNNNSEYPGYSYSQTPTELNYQFYRNLILNSSYIFKSKGTRRSVEFLLNLIGIPESLIEFNEHIEIVDKKFDMEFFDYQYSKISGGTYVEEVPKLDPSSTFKFKSLTFSAFTTNPNYFDVTMTRENFPLDDFGYPKMPKPSDNFFFQKGSGWYQQTPEHTSPEEINITSKIFTGQNIDIQTKLKTFTYGEDYLNKFSNIPYTNRGFNLSRIIDNNKSWTDNSIGFRASSDANFNSFYSSYDEKLIMNIKNVDLFINPAQALIYDIWVQSINNNYPFPSTGLTEFYPVPGGVDSTFINPKPTQKTFFEFLNTFWQNLINARNRLFITDGKTGGYPTLQSIWWKYIEQFKNIGIQNNRYTYQKLIDYSNSLNPYWNKLVEQMIPATTLWQSGIKYENSVLNRQKFIYRRDRGCVIKTIDVSQTEGPRNGPYLESYTPLINVQTINNSIPQEYVEVSIYPWNNQRSTVSSFSDILYNKINENLLNIGLSLENCKGAESVISNWYLDLRIGDDILIQENFFNGLGINNCPNDEIWEIALINHLPKLVKYGLSYFISDSILKIVNLTTQDRYKNKKLQLNVGLNIEFTC